MIKTLKSTFISNSAFGAAGPGRDTCNCLVDIASVVVDSYGEFCSRLGVEVGRKGNLLQLSFVFLS